MQGGDDELSQRAQIIAHFAECPLSPELVVQRIAPRRRLGHGILLRVTLSGMA
jgi:hypothetical protein